MSRPKIDDPRDYILNIRMNNEEKEKLESICECTDMSKADVVRCLVEGCYRNMNEFRDKESED